MFFNALTLLCVSTLPVAQQTFHADNARSGVFNSPSMRSLEGVKWRFKTDGPILGSPALSKGVFFFGSLDTFLYAVDETTGLQKWKFETKGGIASTPAVSNGTVYFDNWDGFLYAVDEVTGKLKWKFAMAYERKFQAKHLHGQEPKEQTIPDVWDFFTSSPAVANGKVYFGSGDRNIYAVDADSGKLSWKFATSEVVHGSPAVVVNVVYIGGFDSRLYALDSDSGKKKWVFQAGLDPVRHNQVGFQASPCVVDGMVYIGCRDAHIYAIDATSGAKKWGYSTGTAWASNTPAVMNGTVLGGARQFYCLDANSGELQHSIDVKSGLFSSVALTNDTAYFGGLNGRLYAFDIPSGKVLWNFSTDAAKADPLKVLDANGQWDQKAFNSVFATFEDDYVVMFKRFSVGSIIASPVVDQGCIYFGSADGTFYALK
jgi:outer membrane protein assembly factor BamB